MPLRISVIGQSGPISETLRNTAYAVGQAVARSGAYLYTGGRDGVMAAASQGARDAGGLTVGILPGDDPNQANPYVSVPITTGLSMAGRSEVLIHSADAFLIVGGGAGTLTEVCVAYLYGKPLVALRGTGGWGDRLESALLEGKYLDHRRMVPIYFEEDPERAVALAVQLAQAAPKQTYQRPSGLGDVPAAAG